MIDTTAIRDVWSLKGTVPVKALYRSKVRGG